jgi:hypothetical protein
MPPPPRSTTVTLNFVFYFCRTSGADSIYGLVLFQFQFIVVSRMLINHWSLEKVLSELLTLYPSSRDDI